MSFIELDSIEFAYEDGMKVFSGFSAATECGTCTVLTGDNGSGKTTLLRILTGLSFVQDGRYVFDGTEITARFLRDNARSKLFHKRVGFLFQNPDVMLFNPKVYDEIAFGPRQMGLTDEETDRRVRDILELFDIADLAERVPYHLSGGQKKKVALASVIALDPEVLILDEPMSGLDRQSRSWHADFLTELKRAGRTLITATHEPELIQNLADQVIDLS
ncbi:MAG: ABC transporter ATP-binding protein [Lachnospiraceae bacterium]|nr:ABC transporter ATP-binding protein [Lachnospiraceae bacterium]